MGRFASLALGGGNGRWLLVRTNVFPIWRLDGDTLHHERSQCRDDLVNLQRSFHSTNDSFDINVTRLFVELIQ